MSQGLQNYLSLLLEMSSKVILQPAVIFFKVLVSYKTSEELSESLFLSLFQRDFLLAEVLLIKLEK